MIGQAREQFLLTELCYVKNNRPTVAWPIEAEVLPPTKSCVLVLQLSPQSDQDCSPVVTPQVVYRVTTASCLQAGE